MGRRTARRRRARQERGAHVAASRAAAAGAPGVATPALAAIFATALLVRLVHVWQLGASPFGDLLLGDSAGYDRWARELAAGDWLGAEVFYQAPLYPYLLGVVHAALGSDVTVVRVCQAVLGSTSAVLLAAAGGRFFSPRVGIAAGAVLALYAPAIFVDATLQKSVVDVFLLAGLLWLLSLTLDGAPPPAAGSASAPSSARSA